MINLDQIARQLGYTLTPVLPLVKGVSIDSRKIQPGYLFAALKGEHFDGHDFIAAAEVQGAAAILCERVDPQATILQWVVPDVLETLTQMAILHRQTISCPIIALTGSNGKTTVKEMIASILPKPAQATPGNLNNHIGVPLSILRLNNEHRYAVFELGANHPGEIAHTVAIAKPQISLINNIAPAHIEGFGSIDGVARAKGEIYEGLAKDGTAIVNDDDEYACFWNNLLKDKKILRFSLHKPVDVYAKNIHYSARGCASFDLVSPLGNLAIQLQVPGEHSIRNALAAVACCCAAGISLADIGRGLTSFKGVAGRMTYLSGKNQSLVIDDTYNANLRSVLTAVDVLAKREGQRILVLGDMGELGAWTQEHHEKIGHAAQQQGIDKLLTCGKHSAFAAQSFGLGARHYGNQEELAQDLLALLSKDTTVLVKGSRSARMEKIVQLLVA